MKIIQTPSQYILYKIDIDIFHINVHVTYPHAEISYLNVKNVNFLI